VNEVGIYYTGSYLCLGSFFMRPGSTGTEEGQGDKETRRQGEVLLESRPNPGKNVTLAYLLPEEAEVTLVVYDLAGRKVATLVQGTQGAGRHEVNWSPDRDTPPGVYFLRLQAGDRTRTEKVTLLR